MRIITASQVEALLPMADCIALMRHAMALVSSGGTVLPLRQFVAIPGGTGKLAVMPGYIADPASFGVKLVSKFTRSADSPHGSHVGAVMLFDAEEGIPHALIDGATLTAIRTAAASALATDILARPDARRLLVTGTGEQARRHVAAIRAVRHLESVTIWGRNAAHAEALAAETGGNVGRDLDRAVGDADIICTTTSATTPYLRGAALSAGVHVNLVGAAVATNSEADSEVVRRSRFFVDSRPAAMAAAGELLDAGAGEGHIAGEIGEVLLGRCEGRRSSVEITVYKSLGLIAQDLVAAHAVWRAAEAAGAGIEVDLSQ